MATNHQTESTAMQIGEVAKRFRFRTRTGRPVSPSNIIRRHLHPALKKLNRSTCTPERIKLGTMRFGVSETLSCGTTPTVAKVDKYWLGHAGKDMSDLYDKIKEGVLFCKKWAGAVWFRLRIAFSFTEHPEMY
jgi:hypothetical protein